MTENNAAAPSWTLGIDLGDRSASFCWIDREGKVGDRGELPQTAEALTALCAARGESIRVAFEVGTHSGWISALLEEQGHEVNVANCHRMKLIARSKRKTDGADAELLARIARSDPSLLCPILHRGKKARQALQVIRSRAVAVKGRKDFVNHVRGAVKAHGQRIPPCSTASFHKLAPAHVPPALRSPLRTMIELIENLTNQIAEFDRQVRRLCQAFPETDRLRQIAGVGPITALCFALVIDDPDRFSKSRTIGAYLGLAPRSNQSGDRNPELGITKAGDGLLRTLLVQSAQYILGHFGPDTDLRRWGLDLASRGAKNAKKRAVIAVARKLAVLMLALWKSGATYEPDRKHQREIRRCA